MSPVFSMDPKLGSELSWLPPVSHLQTTVRVWRCPVTLVLSQRPKTLLAIGMSVILVLLT